jgi:catechol 2,3-dioxygenase-like lactoylglutathione lyase family enzyme|tara:strand:+ start:730 stop:1158 length:429 start_codon:yes stop_codon:yes gene_type:complete
MITDINHSGIVVPNLEIAIDFYTNIMKLKLVEIRERDGSGISQVLGYEKTQIKVADVSTPTGQIIELIEYINPRPQNTKSSERAELTASHIAFNVINIQEVYEFLIKNGGVSLNPPLEITAGKSVCYLQDPFGNWLELIEMS